MKIILCKWGSICEPGLIRAMRRANIDIIEFNRKYNDVDYDKDYFEELAGVIMNNRDTYCVFSINYMPIVSRAVKPFKIPYISLVVDSPCSTLYSKTFKYEHNYAFVLDRLHQEKVLSINSGKLYHTLLASDIDYWDSIKVSDVDREKYSCDVSFIGSLYQEYGQYNMIEPKLDDYTRGYADALISAQQNVFGYNFMEDSITLEWAKKFKDMAELSDMPEDYVQDLKYIVSGNYLNFKCTSEERINTLNELGKHFMTDLYTISDVSRVSNVNCKGYADFDTVMPKIFKCSKINLNITHRGIQSGIPQRVFDIMGCGGFLISNYQTELAENFVDGEDLVLYDSIPDLVNKVRFYLEHEEERIRVARNGYEKVKKNHTYDKLLNKMLSVLE